jgi:N-acyl-D-aspartate/D-glutamate deacylase
MATESGRPLSISVAQSGRRPEQWRELLDAFGRASAEGVPVRGQVGARAVGLLLGFEGSLNPFLATPAYKDLARLPLPERLARLRRPEVRQAILDGMTERNEAQQLGGRLIGRFDLMFPLGDPPDYEPDPSSSVAARAEREGRSAAEVAYDLMLERNGSAFLYVPAANYVGGTLDSVREQLLHPMAVPGLSDGGAHVGTICDVSFPTTLLQWWGRDRPSGRIPVETLIAKQCRATAETVGLYDRGVLAPGYLADVNVIDFDALRLHAPQMAYDLPAGGKRLLQRAEGYRHTFKRGVEIMSDGEATGELPGRLVRGAQPAPA